MIRRHHVIAVGMALVLIAPALVSAVALPNSIVPSDCNGAGGCTSVCDLAQLAQNILNAGIFIAVFISAFLFAWAGIKLLTAGGESGKISSARKIFTNVIVGLVIILIGWFVVDTVMRALLGANYLPWNKIC